MDPDLYDEFGNYIGPEIESDDDDEPSSEDEEPNRRPAAAAAPDAAAAGQDSDIQDQDDEGQVGTCKNLVSIIVSKN